MCCSYATNRQCGDVADYVLCWDLPLSSTHMSVVESSKSVSLTKTFGCFYLCRQFFVDVKKRNRSKNLLPLWGPDDSFHFNPMLLEKIIKSPYFQKCCQDLTDWNALVDEVYYQVKHLEPWALGTSVNSNRSQYVSVGPVRRCAVQKRFGCCMFMTSTHDILH